MKGLELSRRYWEAYGDALFEGVPAEVRSRAAVGLAGAGSECLGFDDEVSRDHDFGPGFCVWLPSDVLAAHGASLQCRYDALPSSFMGCERVATPMAGQRVGVLDMAAFYREFTGLDRAPRTAREWLAIPEQALAAAISGEVFSDPSGRFSAWRDELASFYPDPVIKKKLAADLASMAQAGQYNLGRCLARGELAAANAARAEFLMSLMAALHLLARRPMPFYKWSHASLRTCPGVSSRLAGLVERIAATPVAQVSHADIELACATVLLALHALGWVSTRSDFLLDAARELQASLEDPSLRACHIATGAYRA